MAQSRAPVTWSSRFSFLMATIGAAVGLGNLWRFPYIAGENGGGGFVLLYLGFVFLLGLPLVTAEMLMGRRGRGSAIATMARLVSDERASRFWKLIGGLSVFLPVVGLSYYAVVAAWSLDYFALATRDAFAGFDAAAAKTSFAARSAAPLRQALLHGLFMLMTVAVVARGVNKGIERVSRFLLPALLCLIVLLAVYGFFRGDFRGALEFLFRPDFSSITGRSVLLALGQALFSLAIGVGAMITYAAYMPADFSLHRSALTICFGDTLVALLAGLAIFPIVFASGLDPAGGPGLLFVTLPIAFGSMPLGEFVGPLFFLLLIFAAYTTALAMLEPLIAWLSERTNGDRVRWSIVAGLLIWLLGLLSVFSFSLLAGFHPLGVLGVEKTVFALLDFGIANFLLPLNALLIALFAGWVLSRGAAHEELGGFGGLWFGYWRFALRYLAPVAIVFVCIDLLGA